MKKITSLLLAFTFLCAIGLPALAVEDPAFSVEVVGTIDSATRFDGRDTLAVTWQIVANKPNLTLTNTQGIRLAYDNTVLQLIRWNAASAYLDNTIGTVFASMTGAGALGDFESDTLRVYAARNASGDTGFLNLTVGDEGSFCTCVQGKVIPLVSIRFAFREGKSAADLGPGSLRLMTVGELAATSQSAGVLLNTQAEGGLTTISHVYLGQQGGVPRDDDTLNSPIIVIIHNEKVATPTANPPPGQVAPGTMVTLSCATPGTTIHYTTNGSEPTESSPVYLSPIKIDADMTIKAKAFADGYTDSDTGTFAYTVIDETNVLTFTVESVTARAGDYVEVPITITNNPGIAGITRLQISWDSSKLMYDDRLGAYNPANNTAGRATWPFSISGVGETEGIFDGLTFVAPAEGTAKTDSFIRFTISAMENSYEDGCLLTLKFKVKDGVEPGAIDLILSLDVLEDENGANIPFNTVNGVIVVSDVVYGDVNGDGRITASDVTMLLQYLAEWDVGDSINLANADVNGDGRITASDVTLLLQYLAEWDVTLGPQ